MLSSDLAPRSPLPRTSNRRAIRHAVLAWRHARALVRKAAAHPLLRDTEGAIFAEYVTLLVVVTIGASAATLALGVPLLRFYRYVQMVIAIPFP